MDTIEPLGVSPADVARARALALRRCLVDHSFLDRSAGEYWRCGGSIEV